MSNSNRRRLLSLLFLAMAVILGAERLTGANNGDQPAEFGPHVVILDELEDEYEPVPFDHLSHAKMAEMWNGCETCHHRPPQPVKSDAGSTVTATPTPISQDDSDKIPACKSCHEISTEEADIHMPSLKGAYHRQCLNCHKEWMHENACVICHEPKNGEIEHEPSPDDIIGRMHPPIPEPDAVYYDTRFTPADGGNVLFRHTEHTVDYQIKCVSCHHQDSCSHCHSPGGDTNAQKPLQPGMTWDESHGPCMSCHQEDRCEHCHFQDDEPPPPPFEHAMTGQLLDEDHANLSCNECHSDWWRLETSMSCGGSECHKEGPVAYPDQLPGPLAPILEEASTSFHQGDEMTTLSAGEFEQ